MAFSSPGCRYIMSVGRHQGVIVIMAFAERIQSYQQDPQASIVPNDSVKTPFMIFTT